MAVVNSFALFAGAIYPAQSDVLSTAPTYGDPINVLNGTASGATGYPSEDDVRFGTVFGSSSQSTGNMTLPVVGDVRSGTQYGTNGTEFTGTLVVSGSITLPAITDVLNGVTYGDPAALLTGTYLAPSIGQVESGVSYGAGGTQFTGTYLAAPYGIQNETRQITRGDDSTIEWVSNGSWTASGSIEFGIVGSTGSLQVAGTIVDSTTVTASLTAAQTDALRDPYSYDVQMTDSGGDVSHLVEGLLIVRDTETDIPANQPLPARRPL